MGNLILLFFIFFFKFLSLPILNKKDLGTFILFFLNIIRDNSLSIAKLDERIPECVYGIFNDSNIF